MAVPRRQDGLPSSDLMRYSITEAVKRGWLTEAAAREMRTSAPPAKQYTSELPQERLFRALKEHFGARVHHEFAGAVPGRKYRIDIAIPDARLGIECDGFRFHRSLEAFKSDRRRRNDLEIHGWRILNYFPEQIFKDIEGIVEQVAKALGELPINANASE